MKNFLLFLSLILFSSYSFGQKILAKPTLIDSLNYCGDNQVVSSGSKLNKPIRILVTDNSFPIKDVPVHLKILYTPNPEDKGYLVLEKIHTNKDGIAEFNYIAGKTAGDYILTASINNDEKDDILVYKVTVRPKYWALLVIFGLLGGLGLFLFGIGYMSNGLQQSAGNKLRTILSSLTYNRISGFGVGAFITTIIQSSSATSVMLISFVDSGLMKFRQSIAVIIGAALGTTLTIQMVAMNLSNYALAFVAAGFLMSFLKKWPKIINIGQIVTGLGLLFLGLMLMSEAIAPLKTFQPVMDALVEMENPLIGIIAGIIFTAITQSASAFIGIVVILGQQGLISLEASIPMLIGSNVGTSITAIIAAVGTSTEAKKVAFAHTAYRTIGALLIIWWIPGFADLVRAFSVSETNVGASIAIPRQIANSHTLFYIGLTIISLPFTTIFAKFVDWIAPKHRDKETSYLAVQYLDDNLLSTPPLALNLVKQETVRMANITQDMINDILLPFLLKEPHVLPEIEKNQRLVSFLRDKNMDYLLKISRQQVHDENTQEAFQMLAVVKEIEQIDHIVSSNLLPKARAWISSESNFSEDGKREIVKYHTLCQKQFRKAIEVFRDVNLEKAKTLKKKAKEYNSLVLELEKNHFSRLVSEVEQSVGSSKTHIELLGMLNAITNHATNIARILLTSVK